MKRRKFGLFATIVLTGLVMVGGVILAQSNLNSSVTVGNAAPSVSSVQINHSTQIILNPNSTTNVDVNATIADNNGCSDITGGTTTILIYRDAITSSTCFGAQNQLNCYKLSAFTSTSSCSGGTNINTTTTFAVQFFAQATDASSSFNGKGWQATVYATDAFGATSTADSGTTTLRSLTAINISQASISYGTLSASSTSAGVNQSSTLKNAGNTSSTLNLSGTSFVSGSNHFATTSQHYATATFTFGTGDTALTDSAAAVSGFTLIGPTTTTNVTGTIFWGVTVPGGTPTGTFTATTTFTPIFSS